MNICPICGYPDLYEPAYMKDGRFDKTGDSSFEICPSCGIEFGYQDATPVAGREKRWAELRQKWIEGGMKWHSEVDAAPMGWNPIEQLKAIQ